MPCTFLGTLTEKEKPRTIANNAMDIVLFTTGEI